MTSSTFTPQRFSKSARIHLLAPIAQVFPLFNPIGEREWAAGWDPEILYPLPERVEEHMVFKTHPRHAHGEPETIWTMSKYLTEQGSVEYTLFTPERTWWIAVHCTPCDDGQATDGLISYTYTGLTELGNVLNEKAMQVMFAHDLKDWEEEINHYLKTGRKLDHQSK